VPGFLLCLFRPAVHPTLVPQGRAAIFFRA
jgi:hypothetical protein